MECEPFITSDDRLCTDYADEVIEGIHHVSRWLGIKEAIIGTEDNTKTATANMLRSIETVPGGPDGLKISLQEIPVRYPLGAEKVLITTLTGRVVPSGGLPHDVGVLVLNAGTIRYIAHYLKTGMPLVRRFVTVDGSAINNPGNYDIPVGATVRAIAEAVGGFKTEPSKVLMGGPMMGVALDTLENGLIKNNNAILFLTKNDAFVPEESECIYCGRCVRTCPMNLMPTELDHASRKLNIDRLREYDVTDCIECGCCSYICPAKRYLVQNIRIGKQLVLADNRKAGEKA